MNNELDIKAIVDDAKRILEHAKPDEDRPIPVTLAVKHAFSLGIFLHSVHGARLKNLTIAEHGDLVRGYLLEDAIAVLVKKFDNAIQGCEPRVYLDVTGHERDELGRTLVEEHQRLAKRARTLNVMRKPAYSAYLAFDKDFINSGGLENQSLSTQIQAIVEDQ